MTSPRDPDRLIRAVLEEGPTVLPDRALESVLGEVHRTRQRTARGPWRTQPMSRTWFAAAAVIAVVAIGGLAFLASRPSSPAGVGGVATASPSTIPTPTPAGPSASPAPSLGVKAAGTILYGRHDVTAGIDRLYAMSPDATVSHRLESSDSCCIALLPNGNGFVYSKAGPDGRLDPAYRALDGSGFSEWTDPPAGGDGTTKIPGLNLATGAVSSTFDVAFEGWDDKDPNRTGIYVSIDNGGGLIWGNMKRLTSHPGTKHDIPVAFSPDGTRLLFIRNLADPTSAVSGDLYVIGTDGSGLRRLSPSGVHVGSWDPFGSGASWSPDGSQVAFAGFDASRTDGTSSVYVVGATTSAARAITQPGIWTTSARWSPDGTRIAFDRANGTLGDHDLFTVAPDGSGETNLTADLSPGVCCGQWSPDGTKLLVQGSARQEDAPNYDLWSVNADGSGTSQLTADPGDYKWYVWAP